MYFVFILSLTSALDENGWSTLGPGRFDPGKKIRYVLHRSLAGPPERSGRVRKIFGPTAIPSPYRTACSESLNRLRHLGPLKVKFALEQAMKTQSGSRVTALLSH
jgi:hypothetical protein